VSGSESTNGIVFYILAAMVGMALGFVTIWSQIRGQNRAAKQEAEAARNDLEKRIRDYLDLRLTNMQMSIDHLRESLTRVERKLNRQQQQREEDG
jgi:Tfp pilus assembly protein PilO